MTTLFAVCYLDSLGRVCPTSDGIWHDEIDATLDCDLKRKRGYLAYFVAQLIFPNEALGEAKRIYAASAKARSL